MCHSVCMEDVLDFTCNVSEHDRVVGESSCVACFERRRDEERDSMARGTCVIGRYELRVDSRVCL